MKNRVKISTLKSPRPDWSAIAQWYQANQRNLPWRNPKTTPYETWISEIMLQQTTVKTAIPYFERWMTTFPSLSQLSKAALPRVLRAWSGLGYYSRARNIHKAAKLLQTQWNGNIPSEVDNLISLPGVGRSTAGAISSIAFNRQAPILDANVKRVLSRFFSQNDISVLWEHSAHFVREAHSYGMQPRHCNQALMEIGALVCSAKKPACSSCPLKKQCRSHLENRIEEFPKVLARQSTIHLLETRLLVMNGAGRVLLTPSEQWQKGLWDLPSADDPRLQKYWPRRDQEPQFQIRYTVTRHRILRFILPIKIYNMKFGYPYSWKTFEFTKYPHTAALKKSLKICSGIL